MTGKEDKHHWLQIPDSDASDPANLIDPTARQYTHRRFPDGRRQSVSPPHGHGTHAGFMTLVPSRRAQAVIDRLANSLAQRPIPGVSVDLSKVRDPEASPRKPYREAAYSGLKAFYKDSRAELPSFVPEAGQKRRAANASRPDPQRRAA